MSTYKVPKTQYIFALVISRPCVIVQMLSGRPLIVEAWVRFWACLREV